MAGNDTRYFKVGLFVLTTLFLLITGIVLLGSGVIFRPESVEFESYFDTTVEGLNDGSPVKFRGVPIGSVSLIDFASNHYEGQANKPISVVLVRSRILTKRIPKGLAVSLSGATLEERREIFGALVKRGLRVRITTSGIAGITYLELDYHSPADSRMPALDWTPEVAYVPAIPGFTTQLTESLENTLDHLAKVPFETIGKDLDKVLVLLAEEFAGLELQALSREATALISELRKSNAAFYTWFDSPAMQQMPDEMAGLVNDAHDLVASLETKLPAMSDEAQAGVKEARIAIGRVRRYVQDLEARTDRILADFATVAENLKAAAEDAQGHPSRTLFGAPPPKREDQ